MTTTTTTTKTETELRFTVYGIPVAQGSKVAFVNRSTGKPFIVDSANLQTAKGEGHRLDTWRMKVRNAAIDAAKFYDWTQTREPVRLALIFMMPRPKDPTFQMPAVKPDLSKLFRAVEDGIGDAKLYHDDCEVIEILTKKVYATTDCGVEVILTKGLENE